MKVNFGYDGKIFLRIPNEEWKQRTVQGQVAEQKLIEAIAAQFAPLFKTNFAMLGKKEKDELRFILSKNIRNIYSDDNERCFEEFDDNDLVWVDASLLWEGVDKECSYSIPSLQPMLTHIEDIPFVVYEENKLSDLTVYQGLDVQDIFSFNGKFFVVVSNSIDLAEYILKEPSTMTYEDLKANGKLFCKKENIQKVLRVC